MKPIRTFKIGSRAFFSEIPGYSPKDIDELCIMDKFDFKGNSIHINGLHGKDVFFFRNMTKAEFLEDIKNTKLPMCIGKFLVPEFAEYLGLSIDDLKSLETIIEEIDPGHDYEKIIYNSYIKNGGFYLTPEQRQEAYNKYKETRNG